MRDLPTAHFLLFCFFFLMLLPWTQAAYSPEGHICLDSQKSVLLQLQQEFDNQLSWHTEMDCCSWEGVKCNIAGYVIGLKLKFNGVIYSNSSLFRLDHLQQLNLAHSVFNLSPFPTGFDRLSRLTHLNLSTTCFSGQIPWEFSLLTRLVSLDLSTHTNNFCSPSLKLETPNLEALIENLASLVELYLDGVDLSAQGNDWSQVLAQALPKLSKLSLPNCGLSGPVHSSLSKLVFLSELRLDGNYLSIEAPELLANLSYLKILSLSSCGLHGDFPSGVFQLPNLQILGVSNNSELTGQLPDSIGNLRSLMTLKLSRCNFNGSVSPSLANLTQLTELDLSANSFTGSFPASLANLTQLAFLDLSFNHFNGSVPLLNPISQLESLFLGSNNFSGTVNFDMFRNLENLKILDLSKNLLSLEFDNTSFVLPQLQGLYLGSCHIKEFPNLLRSPDKLRSLNLSNNQIHGYIPSWILKGTLSFLDISSNNLTGLIPDSICQLNNLEIFLASNNNLSGSVPECLVNIGPLSVLHLEGNGFHGMPQNFTSACNLKSLNLKGNILEGKVPMSLANCKSLEILDLADNKIVDSFPFWLGNLPMLQILILRFNKFYGPIGHPPVPNEFPMLTVMDLSSNRFTGNLPPEYFRSLRAMMSKTGQKSEAGHNILKDPYYKESFAVKGRELEYSGIVITLLSAVDLSNNRFEGEIPEVIGDLTSLIVLNLSRNDLTSQIPSSFGNMKSLESLDLSSNKLYGRIPQELTNLNNLDVVNFSQNNLEGPIPEHKQFATFDNSSYSGNPGLCGTPLSRNCEAGVAPGFEEIVCGTVIRIILPQKL